MQPLSKWGEGTGTAMQQCSDPNKPSYDPATNQDQTTKKLIWLCENAWDKMTAWEKKFCLDVYGKSPISRKRHITVWKIHRKFNPEQP
jgi:hypothetical protein